MSLSVLIKPCGSACNLKCGYCFYTPDRHISSMPDSEYASVIAKTLGESAEREFTIVFQGGEPLLAGIEFYMDFIESTARYAPESKVNYCIQTNATLIDRQWCKFFKDYDILVGISLDGTKYVNDKHRYYADGTSVFAAVTKSIKLLESYGVEYNILSVITKELCRHAKENINFLARNYKYLQFTMPVKEEWNVDALPNDDEMYEFLDTAFDVYWRRFIEGEYLSVRYYDNLVRMAGGRHPEQCGLDGACTGYLTIDSDLNCYPCDFYVTGNNLLGNLKQDSIACIMTSAAMREFKSYSNLPSECAACEVGDLCRGGCKRYREEGKYYFCRAVKKFLLKNLSAIKTIASAIFND